MMKVRMSDLESQQAGAQMCYSGSSVNTLLSLRSCDSLASLVLYITQS